MVGALAVFETRYATQSRVNGVAQAPGAAHSGSRKDRCKFRCLAPEEPGTVPACTGPMRRSLLTVLLSALVSSTSGCEGTDDGASSRAPLRPVPTFEEFADAYAQQICSGIAGCCSSAFDQNFCVTSHRDDVLTHRDQLTASGGYDPKLGQACMASLASVTGACRIPVRDLIRDGASCTLNRFTGSLEADCSFPCTILDIRHMLKIGEACTSDAACLPGGQCFGGKCVALTLEGAGRPCSTAPLADGAIHRCDGDLQTACSLEGVCVALPGGGNGEPCRPAEQFVRPPFCAPGLICDVDSICRPPRPVGARCESDQQCESAACEGTCVDPRTLQYDVTKLTWTCP